jgi:hypothetical protein
MLTAELGRVGGCVVAVNAKVIYGDGSTGHQTLRLMTQDEEAALRSQVAGALPRPYRITAIAKRPISYAIAWPSLGIALLGLHALNYRHTSK